MFRHILQTARRGTAHLSAPFVAGEPWAFQVVGNSECSFASRPAVSHADNVPGWGETSIGQVMKFKEESGSPTAGLFSCTPGDTVFEAVKKMAHVNVGSIVVMTKDGTDINHVAGIITERDYMRKVVVAGKNSKEMRCDQLMTPTSNIISLTSGDSVYKAMQLMEERNIRHIPVIDGGQLRGMLSIKDVVATMIAEHKVEVNSMADYIGGSY